MLSETPKIRNSFKIKKVQFDDGVKVKLQLWDTAGQERFRTITSAYYRGAMGIVLTYDITDEASFTAIRNWVKNVESNAAADVNRILVGNKSDMEKQRVVSTERGQALADEFGLKFFETSAKSGAGVEESFRELAWQVKERLSANSETAGAGKASTTGGKASSSRVKAEGSTGRKLSFWGSARKYSSGDGSSRRRGTKCSGSRGSCSGASASS